MRKQTAIIFYALAAYVVLQFGWWGLHLINLTQELNNDAEHISKRALMILGEGTVFFVIVILGLWKIRSSIKKELQLSHQQRNFILSVTHELKTPLSSIKLYLQTLNRRSLAEEQRTEIVTNALKENTRLEHMIENILTVSRIENGAYLFHPEDVNVNSLIEQVVHPFNIDKQLKIEVICTKDLTYHTDKSALESIFSNLLENALKYAGKDAQINIQCELVENKLQIMFSDNGPGIPPDRLNDIFGRFVRLENEDTRQSKGAGLGLYIVDQFVRGQQGFIKAINNEPSGLKFIINI